MLLPVLLPVLPVLLAKCQSDTCCLLCCIAEGRDELVKELHMQLLPGAGVQGLLLHGMGGAGKSTLATMLSRHLQQSGVFAGGVFRVTVLQDIQYRADSSTLLAAQQRLLSDITAKSELLPASLDEGAQQLADALSQNMGDGPVLLVIDNVPEGHGGILGLLPRKLDKCLAEG
jgi:ABC-type transport system involved in cytochrome bd biosynthesis fused ATPase/permease subunit